MALHRDIYWVGKQWAVTGYGIQACDQRQKSKFDIEASRIWEDGVLDDVRAQKWINIKDFDKAVETAREHYPEPAPKLAQPVPSSARAEPPWQPALAMPTEPVARKAPRLKSGNVFEPARPSTAKFEMRIKGWPAKFTPMWRIRIGR